MKKLALVSFLALALCGLSFAQEEVVEEVAAEESGSAFSYLFTFASDYRFRGISQTRNDPALQATVTAQLPQGFYVSAFASNVDFGPASPAFEIDLTGGWATSFENGLGLDVSLVRYYYPSDEVGLAYSELNTKFTYAGFTGLVGYSNDVFNTDETGLYYNVGYSYSLDDVHSVSASAGYYDLDDAIGNSIVDYSVGVTRTMSDNLNVGLAYIRTNGGAEDFFGITNDSQFVFTFNAGF